MFNTNLPSDLIWFSIITSLEFSELHGNNSVLYWFLLSGICLSNDMARVGRKLLYRFCLGFFCSLMVS